jgi:ubiquinone/menaquinone biosynthesis C-methylase UbiE
MMSTDSTDRITVPDHYRRADLTSALADAIVAAGKTTSTITADDLAPLDEFHIGGKASTIDLMRALSPTSEQHVLDVGCGLGGAARLAAATYGCRVTGVDLTLDYVAAGRAISEWLGTGDRVQLHEADALALPFPDATFDLAYMMHVGMNVPDKARLFTEIARVLRPGARLALYDVMRTGGGELSYPLPWATTADQCAVSTPDAYHAAFESAGFVVMAEQDRRELALEYFARQRAAGEAGRLGSPIGLHLLMGSRREAQVRHMSESIAQGDLSPRLITVQLSPRFP